MNSTTRRHPRTLQEAFGPHTNSFIVASDAPPESTRLVALACIAVFGVALLALSFAR